MANANRPFGLRPVRYLSGAPYNAAVSSFHVPASNASAMFLGDPVILTGTANTAQFDNYPPATLPDVALTVIPAAGVPPTSYPNWIMGSFVGRLPETRESNIYRPASVEALIMCTEDPMLVYQIQDNGANAAGLGPTVVGSNANLIAGVGNTTTGQSGYMLDAGTVTAPSTAALQVTILRVANLPNNDPNSPFAVWDVVINQHPFAAPSIGI